MFTTQQGDAGVAQSDQVLGCGPTASHLVGEDDGQGGGALRGVGGGIAVRQRRGDGEESLGHGGLVKADGDGDQSIDAALQQRLDGAGAVIDVLFGVGGEDHEAVGLGDGIGPGDDRPVEGSRHRAVGEEADHPGTLIAQAAGDQVGRITQFRGRFADALLGVFGQEIICAPVEDEGHSTPGYPS